MESAIMPKRQCTTEDMDTSEKLINKILIHESFNQLTSIINVLV